MVKLGWHHLLEFLAIIGSYNTGPVQCGFPAVYFTQTEPCNTQLPNSFVAALQDCPPGAAQRENSSNTWI